MAKYKIADIVFEFNAKRQNTKRFLSGYEFLGETPVAFSYTPTDEDERKEYIDGQPDWYVESLTLFRRLAEYVLDNADGIIFHASTIAVGGKAYLFTAPSGTGKSTHTKLLRELLGENAVMINDDKPIVRRIDGKFYAFGTPWCGKHFLGNNIKAEIGGICKLYRAKENEVREAEKTEMIITVLEQTLRFSDVDRTEKLLSIIDGLLRSVKIYALGCNKDVSAAQLSYSRMMKGE